MILTNIVLIPMVDQVMIRQEDTTVNCSCNRFEQFGLLCSHIFYVLRMLDITEFPKQYILRRWVREAVPNSSSGAIIRQEDDPEGSEDINRVVREISRGVEYVIDKLVSNFDKLCNFRDHVNQFIPVADESIIDAPPKTRRDRFAELTGVSQPSSATIRVPIGIKFKGCGSHRRMKSKREQAISQLGKKQKMCSKCNTPGHNSRTCGRVNRVPKKLQATTSVDDAGDSSETTENEEE